LKPSYNILINQTTCRANEAGTQILNLETEAGCDSTITIVTTHVPLTASFTYTRSGNTFTFNNTSTGAQSWLWAFGDGTYSTAQHPTHTYPRAGIYIVQLYTYAPGCRSRASVKIIFIRSSIFFANNLTSGAEQSNANPQLFPQESNLSKVNIYPNPTFGPLQIDLQQGWTKMENQIQIAIFSIHGVQVGEEVMRAPNLQMDLSHLKAGTYIIRLTSGTEVQERKIVILK
jgi:PKD repeat protein